MHVLNVSSSIDLKAGGGGAERTFQMSRFLERKGVQCTILTIDNDLDMQRVSSLAPATVIAFPSLWKRFHVPRISWKTIRRLVDEADIIHLMAHWSALNVFVYLAIRLAGKPYVFCPAGTLPLFGRSGWLKRIYNYFMGNSIVRDASAWIAVTAMEFPHFEVYGIERSRVAVIPNGVNQEDFPEINVKAFLAKHNLPDAPMILFMGRLNLIKGPDLLLQAFFLVHNIFPDHHLVFAGPDGGMLAELKEAAVREGLSKYIHFIGYVNGIEKSAAYRCAKLLVVPSRQEAMSIVALEAGICGTPVLLTDQCGFGDICSVDPRLEVAATIKGISEGLIELLSDKSTLKDIAPLWNDFVVRRYSWESIVPQYTKLYHRILGTSAGEYGAGQSEVRD